MNAIGKIPDQISLLEALDSIGETILIADTDYTVRWINTEACRLLADIAPLFGLKDCHDFLNKNMSFFHRNPEQQQRIMENLKTVHRARISIKDQFVADIVITPIRNDGEKIAGFIVMLMDVTTQAEEQVRKEELIKELSTPILNIWHSTIALPLIGEFDQERSDQLIATVLTDCVENRNEYVLIDLSGLKRFESEAYHQIQKLLDGLRLIGSTGILTGINPKLALSMAPLESKVKTFSSSRAGLEYIMELQKT